MSYKLVLSEAIDAETKKKVGENVFFDDLPPDCQVYVLYYPGTSLNKDLANRLRNLGKITGNNLFVNVAKLDDPNFKKIVNRFGIRAFPTIIITAIAELASPPTGYSTAYVKIDNKRLLNSTDLAFECVQKMFSLFIDGKISEAIREQNRDMLMSRIKGFFNDALKGVKGYLKEWDLSFSFITGKLELKPRGG